MTNTVHINGAIITKTTDGIFYGMIEGTWFDAAALAEKIQKVAGMRRVKIYDLMPGWKAVEVG